MTNNEVGIVWYTGEIIIVNSPPKMEKELLTIMVKELLPASSGNGWKKEVRKKKQEIFELVKEKPFRTIVTDHGHFEKVMMWLTKNGYKFVVQDLREDLPRLDVSKIMGLRYSQKPLLIEALERRRSGLLVFPTRYGKSHLILNTLRALPDATTVVTAPGEDLLKQTTAHLKESLPERNIVQLGGGSKVQHMGDDITVCSMDSLYKCSFDKVKALLVDEPHACVTDSRIPNIRSFKHALRYGFSATPKGRFDGKDPLIEGVIGPVLVERTFTQAVAEGAICGIDCVLIVIDPVDKSSGNNRDVTYRKFLWENPVVGGVLGMLCNELIPKDWQTLAFIKSEKQAEFQLKYIGETGTIAMAKRLSKSEREEMFESMASGEVKRCLASDIYAQGVTFSDLRAVINLAGGGPYTNTVQKPGRLAERRDGKVTGLMFDFVFAPDAARHPGTTYNQLANDSRRRYEVYKEKGYYIHFVKTHQQLRDKLKELVEKNS
jgi:superfamily II DNA or RNA helicase